MTVTNAENQELKLKKNIRDYFFKAKPLREKGRCPTTELFSASLDKWSMFCLLNLGYYEVLRFNELKHKVDGISARMLSVTLKKLEQNGLVDREVYPEVPPRVEYSLTPFGKGFSEKMVDLGTWLLNNSEVLHTHQSPK